MRRTLTLLTAMGALLMSAVPASAVTSADAVIDVHSDFGVPNGTFVADSDLLCDSGTTTDQTLIAGNGRAITFHNLKTFECADGSGTFTVRIQAQVKPCSPTTAGVWNVAGGTGDYEDLRGTGSLVGTYFPVGCEDPEGIDDHLTGTLRLP